MDFLSRKAIAKSQSSGLYRQRGTNWRARGEKRDKEIFVRHHQVIKGRSRDRVASHRSSRDPRCMQECDCDCRIQDGPGQERIRQWLESAGNKRRRACVVLYFMISQTCTLTANFRFHSKKDGKCASAESAERNSFKSSVSHHNATNHRVAAADSTHG